MVTCESRVLDLLKTTGNWFPMAWPDGQPIVRGDEVICQRVCPARGSWSHFRGMGGKVAAVVPTITESERTVWVGEVGVDLGMGFGLAWFLPEELVRTTPVTRPQRPSVGQQARGGHPDTPEAHGQPHREPRGINQPSTRGSGVAVNLRNSDSQPGAVADSYTMGQRRSSNRPWKALALRLGLQAPGNAFVRAAVSPLAQ